ncbi:MAG TPA: hypothetical protein PLF78_13950 [Caulobacter sp.]|nr:hypothetical protein [Caulobacter sp.]
MDRRLALAAALALIPTVASASGGEKKKGGGITFVQVKAVAATIIRRDGSRGVITVECGIDIADNDLRTKATAVQPRLRDAYAGFLQGYAGGLPKAALPNADYIAAELQKATDRVLGKKGGKLLIGTILIN